jgi:hypothetical protein
MTDQFEPDLRAVFVDQAAEVLAIQLGIDWAGVTDEEREQLEGAAGALIDWLDSRRF